MCADRILGEGTHLVSFHKKYVISKEVVSVKVVGNRIVCNTADNVVVDDAIPLNGKEHTLIVYSAWRSELIPTNGRSYAKTWRSLRAIILFVILALLLILNIKYVFFMVKILTSALKQTFIRSVNLTSEIDIL